MGIRVTLEFDYDDYSSLDDTTGFPLALTQREAAIAASILSLLEYREAWDATDSEFDAISATIALLIESVQDAL